MVSKRKIQAVKELKEMAKKYPVIGVLNMFKLPGKQLHDIRNKLRKEAVIRMAKKRVISIVFRESNLSEMEQYLKGEPALLFSSSDPFKLSRKVMESKSKAAAKEGDIAPIDIEVKAGPTPLAAGPVIGELQRLKIPCAVENEKIAVKQDTVIAKEGDAITKPMADIMSKLGIEPMEIGLDIVAVWEKGYIYAKDILSVTQKEYIDRVKESVQKAFNLSININYFTKESIPFILSKAHSEFISLSTQANIITPDTIGNILAKVKAEAESIESKMK